jgi:hypothetical protein
MGVSLWAHNLLRVVHMATVQKSYVAMTTKVTTAAASAAYKDSSTTLTSREMMAGESNPTNSAASTATST